MLSGLGPFDEDSRKGLVLTMMDSHSEFPGKLVFYITLVATLAFFWWLLIYDHGVAPTH